ncbi:MAG: hypothetical protein ACERKZ_21930 [Lachnotalea sp.]
MDINVDKQNGMISWIINEVKYEKKYENLIIAYLQEDNIYIKYLNNEHCEINEYCDLSGKMIYAYNRVNGIVTTSSTKFSVENLLSIKYTSAHNLFVAQVGRKRTDSLICIFDRMGQKLLAINAPYHYKFYSLVKRCGEVDVVCQGDESTADLYGRNDWRFSIDYHTGILNRQALEY